MSELLRYRTVATRIYSDRKFQNLSKPQPNGQTLFIYLLTGPQTTNLPGLYSTGKAALAEALEWKLEAFSEAFDEVIKEGLVEFDAKARLLWLPKATKYNPPQSINVVKSWRKAFDELPECPLRSIAFEGFKAYLEAFPEAFRKPFDKPLLMASPIQEQEQEQIYNTRKEYREKNSDSKKKSDNNQSGIDAIVDAWNSTDGATPIIRLNEARKKHLNARLSESDWKWKEALAKFPLRCFMTEGSWKPNFDWFIRPGTVNGILEGKYDWTKENGASKQDSGRRTPFLEPRFDPDDPGNV
jgi:hypothetical protein